MGDAAVEGVADDAPLRVGSDAVAEVLPQPERDGGGLEPAAADPAIRLGLIAVCCGLIGAGHVVPSKSNCSAASLVMGISAPIGKTSCARTVRKPSAT